MHIRGPEPNVHTRSLSNWLLQNKEITNYKTRPNKTLQFKLKGKNNAMEKVNQEGVFF